MRASWGWLFVWVEFLECLQLQVFQAGLPRLPVLGAAVVHSSDACGWLGLVLLWCCLLSAEPEGYNRVTVVPELGTTASGWYLY